MKPKNTICIWFDKDAHEAARFYAATFPDSKVIAVHKSPGDYPGDKVILSAVVKNIGTAPTPEGVIIGVLFKVDGKVVGWSDNVSTALAPGATVICTANGGAGWTAAPGKHTVLADVDNVDRFPELDKTNNTLEKAFTIAAP